MKENTIFQKNIGKILLAGNLIVLSILIYSTLSGKMSTDKDVLAVTQISLAFMSFLIVYFVLKTWKTFREKDLFVGLSGFILIFIGYTAITLFTLINYKGIALEAGLNTLITLGYLLVTIAVGWLK